ncbi:DarT ssDNA thymidine ADP-ribosyltransferase family protein [Rhizobium leguminosarum]|uniref:DarT ssDNA thymidine ADP-ribosyltransferase family protein n=1 Tax=Rhizobium leguminosarum TaxID=384 RepID=UPI0009E47DB0|nr:DarT ssDNA thymidine ADP-ribosyltransferase family protein [Rhizobium leguminosarum]WFT88406.1 DarT ssDNA thymidine ADP-ribosyltransferase family protein [Rhizobium leguminosarum]
MNEAISEALKARRITRLCHFTPSRNLQHIAAGRIGVLSTASLQGEERAAFNQTDLERLDGRTTHICCSIEFPNAWYFDKARSKEKLFPDWVVLLISPQYLTQDGTLFCPRNAAAQYGRHIVEGFDGFNSVFAPTVTGTGNVKRSRNQLHRSSCPTDEQAEVLIYDRVLLSDLIGVAVASEEQARTERARLRVNGVDPDQFRFVIAPQMFDKYALSKVIRDGHGADEELYQPPAAK